MDMIDVARRVALWLAFAAWLYSWYLIRGLRHAYSGGGINLGIMPSWLLAVMVLASSLLLGATVCAGMRIPAWPGLAAGGGFFLFGLPVLGQFAVMNSIFVRPVSLGRALNEVLQNTGPFEVAVFLAGIPTLLVLAGATGFFGDRLRAPLSEPQSE